VRAKVGTDPSGCDGVGEHSVPGEPARDAFGEAQQAALGGPEGKMVRVIAAVCRSARDIHDDAATTAWKCWIARRDRSAHDCTIARLQVQGQVARPPAPPRFNIFKRRGDPGPGVVHQHVDVASSSDGGIPQAVGGLWMCEVGLHQFDGSFERPGYRAGRLFI
jgi:hypothetical protein